MIELDKEKKNYMIKLKLYLFKLGLIIFVINFIWVIVICRDCFIKITILMFK